MSGLGSWLWGTSQLDDAVDKATSELLPAGAEDIALNLEICDQIRSKSVPAKDAMRALRRRLNHKNPNVQNLALGLTDICIKNGGDLFLSEVASREFMDNLVSILKIPGLNNDVKQNILRLIQNWSVAFEGKHSLTYVGQVYKTLTSEGYNFPPKDLAVANSAMVDTQIAPDWIDSDVCLRCRTAFTFTNRKHHCRNCGQVFDQACSSKSMPLPHFGITQEVRVCEGCFNKLTRKADKADKSHRHSSILRSPRHRSAQELADAELQRAIQLSLQESGIASGHNRSGYVPSQPSSGWQSSEPPIVDRSSHPSIKPDTIEEEDDPDLKAAIEASLREANAPRPSAPAVLESPRTEYDYSQSYAPAISRAPGLPVIPNYDLEPLESDAILTFSQTIEQVQAQGGRDISRYPAVNELYDKASSLRPKLALSLDDAGRKEQMLSEMHDKLSQAVKLYDKLLTEQVVHPRWRSPQAAATLYKPAEANQDAVNGWTSPMQAVTSPYQPPSGPSRSPQSPRISHFNQQAQHTVEQSYTSAVQSQWSQQPPHTIQQYSSAPAFPPQPPPEPLRQQSFDTQPVQQYQPYANSLPQTQMLPPVTLNSEQYQHIPPAPELYNASPPTQTQSPYMSSPPPPPQQLQPDSNTLTRHKSTSYTASPPTAHRHLGRSNTVGAHTRQQQQAQAPYPAAAHPASPPLPHFPVAPTSTPQAFPMYGPPAPTGFAPLEERKEALLIDL